MRQADDGKEYAFNRGDPVSGLIRHSNNESQEVSRGHSSDESRGNPEGAKARTVSCWSIDLVVMECIQHQPRGTETSNAYTSRIERRNNT